MGLLSSPSRVDVQGRSRDTEFLLLWLVEENWSFKLGIEELFLFEYDFLLFSTWAELLYLTVFREG